jgi:hypothetical protein
MSIDKILLDHGKGEALNAARAKKTRQPNMAGGFFCKQSALFIIQTKRLCRSRSDSSACNDSPLLRHLLL